MDKSKNVLSNLMWRFAERFCAQGISFVISIVLARLLKPEDYGTVALTTIFIAILDVFVNCGMGTALVQKKEADNLDFSTVFLFNIVWCTLLYILLFLLAPFIATFYGNDEFVLLIRIAGLAIVISGIKNVFQAYISKNMQFKKFFYAALGGTLLSGVVGIILAYKGFGAWALVLQNLLNMLVDTIVLCIVIDWHIQMEFSFQRLKRLFSFGWKLFISNLLETIYNNMRSLVIGKYYSTADLAFYEKGQGWPKLIIGNINSSIDSVLLPALSAEQDKVTRVKEMTRKAIKVSSYVIWPMLIGLIAIAEPLVKVVLTEKWLPCTLYLQLACSVYMFWPIHTANLNAIQAMGRSDIFLKLEIVKKIIGIASLLLTIPRGVQAIAIGYAITAPIFALINMIPNIKLLDYSVKEQVRDIIPSSLMTFIMFFAVKIVKVLEVSDLYMVLIQISVGVSVYLMLSVYTRMSPFAYLVDVLKKYR